MCHECKTPRIPRFEGEQLILEPAPPCTCAKCIAEFQKTGPRCPYCDHALPIELTDDAETWDPLHLIDGKPVVIRPW